MDLTQLANLGEFIGGVAVLVTLIYLAVQVRENTLGEKAATHRGLVEQWNRAFVEPLRTPGQSEVLRRGFADFNSLSGEEKTIAGMFLAGVMNVAEEVNALRQTPAIHDEVASTFEGGVVAILKTPGGAQWWDVVSDGYSASFCARIEAILASPDCPPPITHWMPWLHANLPDDE